MEVSVAERIYGVRERESEEGSFMDSLRGLWQGLQAARAEAGKPLDLRETAEEVSTLTGRPSKELAPDFSHFSKVRAQTDQALQNLLGVPEESKFWDRKPGSEGLYGPDEVTLSTASRPTLARQALYLDLVKKGVSKNNIYRAQNLFETETGAILENFTDKGMRLKKALPPKGAPEPLFDVIEHDLLRSKVPEMEEFKIEGFLGPFNDQGWIDYAERTIGINQALPAHLQLDPVVHEIQHGVGLVQGFESGTSRSQQLSQIPANKEFVETLLQLNRDLQEGKVTRQEAETFAQDLLGARKVVEDRAFRAYENDPGERLAREEAQRLRFLTESEEKFYRPLEQYDEAPGLANVPEPGTRAEQILQPKSTAKHLRKLMQEEAKARGRTPEGPSAVAKILRGTFFHGRRTHPVLQDRLEALQTKLHDIRRQTADIRATKAQRQALREQEPSSTTKQLILERSARIGAAKTALKGLTQEYRQLRATPGDFVGTTYEGIREKARNFGEPKGISLSADPDVAHGFGTSVRRVRPLYGDVPEKAIIDQTSEMGRQVLQDTYRDTIKDYLKELPEGDFEELMSRPVYDKLKVLIGRNYGTSDEFNIRLTERLREQGYKGLLYSPRRGDYDEYELKMFDPENVLQLDKRGPYQFTSAKDIKSKVMDTVTFNEKKGPDLRQWRQETEPGTLGLGSLREIYQEVNIPTLVQQEANRRGLPYQVSAPGVLPKDKNPFDDVYPDLDEEDYLEQVLDVGGTPEELEKFHIMLQDKLDTELGADDFLPFLQHLYANKDLVPPLLEQFGSENVGALSPENIYKGFQTLHKHKAPHMPGTKLVEGLISYTKTIQEQMGEHLAEKLSTSQVKGQLLHPIYVGTPKQLEKIQKYADRLESHSGLKGQLYEDSIQDTLMDMRLDKYTEGLIMRYMKETAKLSTVGNWVKLHKTNLRDAVKTFVHHLKKHEFSMVTDPG
jgi:hypothetical protein